MHIKIPKVSKLPEFQLICADLKLQPRGKLSCPRGVVSSLGEFATFAQITFEDCIPLSACRCSRRGSLTNKSFKIIRTIWVLQRSEAEGGIYDISNKHRMGYTEVELVQVSRPRTTYSWALHLCVSLILFVSLRSQSLLQLVESEVFSDL